MADATELPPPRTGQGDVALSREQFTQRYQERFYDPLFEPARAEIERITDIAWQAYSAHRKSPRTQKAGVGFADPDYDLSIEWRQTADEIRRAQQRHDDGGGADRLLLIVGSSRHDQTCPGEMSKSFRLARMAEQAFTREARGECDLLDLSHLSAQFGRQILPCKGCASTAMPLCHWPCSCYPNHSLGQVNDWMHEIYPRWVAAHAVMIITPVYWHQSPSPLKLMMDRLVCADGGNPDPSSTHGKKAAEAKALELQGWPYPRHLAGRLFSVFVHGDAESAESVRRALTDWLTDMSLREIDALDRYIGYYEPYATNHVALDGDLAVQQEVRACARALRQACQMARSGRLPEPPKMDEPRPK